MKRILLAVALLVLVVSLAPAQDKQIPQWLIRDKTFYTRSWDSIPAAPDVYTLVRIVVANDSGTGQLIVARQNDTTAANFLTVYQGEIAPLPPRNNSQWLRVKAKTANVHGRVWIF